MSGINEHRKWLFNNRRLEKTQKDDSHSQNWEGLDLYGSEVKTSWISSPGKEMVQGFSEDSRAAQDTTDACRGYSFREITQGRNSTKVMMELRQGHP